MLAPSILLFMAAAEASTPSTVGLLAAVTEVLASDGQIQVRSWSEASPPDDATLMAAARDASARVVARVIWTDADHTQAAIHARVITSTDSLDRIITFAQSDDQRERGRALGLIIGSFALPAATVQPSDAPRASVTIPASPVTAVSTPPHWALEGFTMGGWALDGVGGGLGGGLGLRWSPETRWGLRTGVRARTASVSTAQGSFLTVGFFMGAVYALATGSGVRPGLALRGDILVIYEGLTHFSADDPEPVSRRRFLPGACGAIESEWRLAPATSVFLAAGMEAAFGRTTVLLRGLPVTDIAPLRVLLEAGLRAHF